MALVYVKDGVRSGAGGQPRGFQLLQQSMLDDFVSAGGCRSDWHLIYRALCSEWRRCCHLRKCRLVVAVLVILAGLFWLLWCPLAVLTDLTDLTDSATGLARQNSRDSGMKRRMKTVMPEPLDYRREIPDQTGKIKFRAAVSERGCM
ncbi:hypothetical protein E4U43_002883 [Claviceps pusilla]|uniref:Uncharacterized protein n=1 Tax=Claviceps pusilla TaxID=123648 RepID=A0A9P7T0M7_9HYPO|nr:hypothetical protein E4U43_002883 [Claviceps pusilla]